MIVRDLLNKSDDQLVKMLEDIDNEPIAWTPIILAELARRGILRLRDETKMLVDSSKRLERLTLVLIVLTIVLALLATPPVAGIVQHWLAAQDPAVSVPSYTGSAGARDVTRHPSVRLERGITGLELGMSPERIAEVFTIKEDTDPVAKLLAEYGAPEDGKAVIDTNRSIGKRFFRISSATGRFPNGVTSADVYTFQNAVYHIGLHYDQARVNELGWQGVSAPFVSKYGAPTTDTGLGYVWEDGRTRIDLELSGNIINLFFTDTRVELEVKKAEREHR